MRNTDILLIIPLLWGTYRGFVKGLIAEITSLVAMAVVFYVSIKFYSVVATFLSQHIHSKLSPAYLSIIAFAILFILLMVLVYFISMKIEKVTEALHISLINHFAGALFGLAKWAFIISVVLALIDIFGNKLDFSFVKFNHSWLYSHLQMIAPTVMPGLIHQ